MAERKSGSSKSGDSSTPDSGGGLTPSASPAASPRKAKPKTVKAGGHEVAVEPAKPAKVADRCSIHGVFLKDGKCPTGGHESRGWATKKES